MMCKYAQFLFAAIPLGGLIMNWDDLRFFLALARMPCYVGDSEPSLRRIDVALTPSTWGVWVLSHVDLRSTARVRVCRDFLVEIIEQQRDLIEGLTSRYH